ncbi:Competence protein ComEA helix-hairpin-helix region [Shewanella piezotolerans WP3]|uniref:Competence protein ComEA helix-hairpin-helix region n=1 Tax=Shewanella piezotolerans (strain WP3 / JCM 13877) TaxID=225849 RepID=B8CRD8_SHEPW|nr:helix-hairpin-helix domain-containing protein [Shewanella piezotolerans]ACJ29946.1 Competence protein ComEA helix-hairpin-helix region [Shewanella piezotolerans WP3]
MNKKLMPALLLTSLMSFSSVQAAVDKSTVETSKTSSHKSTQVISINSANVAQLSTLKGVGDSKAKAIVDYRATHGKFSSISELSNVKGIGDKLIEQNKAVLSL